MSKLLLIAEPQLLFSTGQSMEDPRDGLTLFGPLDEGKPYGIRYGVIGSKQGINRFSRWIEKIQSPISNDPPLISRPQFPGFEAAFRIPWSSKAAIEIIVLENELYRNLYLDDKHKRVYQTVEIYSNKIIKAIREEETEVDIWFVIIPDDVKKYCRPKQTVEKIFRKEAKNKLSIKAAKELQAQPSLWEEENIAAIPYQFDVNFHNQLKARLIGYNVPIQIIQESTIAHTDFKDKYGKPKKNLDPLQSAIAWHISTAAFYKTGGRPWKLSGIRDGVCYIGIVFKRDDKKRDPRTACCAAQMFLDSGDGVVFKGAVGPWYNPKIGDFHLRRKDATELMLMAIDSYVSKKGVIPAEMFIHGKVRFGREEWNGFQDAVSSKTNLVGIRIRDYKDLKLFRGGKQCILRGLAYVRDNRTAFLWTKGYTPRLQTYPGREVPKPLLIDVCRGDAKIKTVLSDILALTKLNYNACVFADGEPVTLKFAEAVGEILTAGPIENIPPLPFKYYI